MKTEFKRTVEIRGHVRYELRDSEGNVKLVGETENTITNLFDAHIADQLSDRGGAAIGYLAVGTGSGRTASSTGLATSLARIALASTTQGAGANDNDVIYVATFGAGVGTGTITEDGIMRLDDNATLMAYDDSFGSIVKGALDTLTVTWTITFGAS